MYLALVQKLTALWSSWTHWTEQNWLLVVAVCGLCSSVASRQHCSCIFHLMFKQEQRAELREWERNYLLRATIDCNAKQEWKRCSCLSHSVEISQLLSIHQSTNTYLYDAKSQSKASQSCFYNQRKTHLAISANEVHHWLEKKTTAKKNSLFLWEEVKSSSRLQGALICLWPVWVKRKWKKKWREREGEKDRQTGQSERKE